MFSCLRSGAPNVGTGPLPAAGVSGGSMRAAGLTGRESLKANMTANACDITHSAGLGLAAVARRAQARMIDFVIDLSSAGRDGTVRIERAETDASSALCTLISARIEVGTVPYPAFGAHRFHDFPRCAATGTDCRHALQPRSAESHQSGRPVADLPFPSRLKERRPSAGTGVTAFSAMRVPAPVRSWVRQQYRLPGRAAYSGGKT